MLISLVAAIPAAYLGYELVMAMLSYSQNLSTIAYIVIGLTLLSALGAALIPVVVMVGGKPKAAPEVTPGKKETGDDIDSIDDKSDEESVDGLDEVEVDDDISGSAEFDLGDSSSDILVDDSDDHLNTSQLEVFEDEDEEEEEVKPKAKKKKK